MSTKILSQSQAEAVFSAMNSLNNVGGLIDVVMPRREGGFISVKANHTGVHVFFRLGGETREHEPHPNQEAFAAAYGLNATPRHCSDPHDSHPPQPINDPTQQPLKDHEKDCATCAYQDLPANDTTCTQCGRLATGARANWQALVPSQCGLTECKGKPRCSRCAYWAHSDQCVRANIQVGGAA